MALLWKWISGSIAGILEYFGFSGKAGKICLIGLDNAGKTSLLKKIKDGTMCINDPTWYATKHELSFGGIKITAFDVGGHEQMRRVWKNYFYAVDAIVFLVDTSDRQRLLEARSELESLLSTSAEMDVPVLVLGNKIDRPTATSEDELRAVLGLNGRTTGKSPGAPSWRGSGARPLELFMCSVLKEQGYGAALRWLMSFV